MKVTVFYNHVVTAAKQSGLTLKETAEKCVSFGII